MTSQTDATIRLAEHQLRMAYRESGLPTSALRLEPAAATDEHPYPHVAVSAGRHLEHTSVGTDAEASDMVARLLNAVERVLKAHAADRKA